LEAREYLSEVHKKDLIVENTLFELEQVEALATRDRESQGTRHA
jgi:hypothetical protein